MESVNFKIYKGTERIGILPGKFVNKTELHEKYILLGNDYIIKSGYIIYADKDEKFYVTDVRVHRSCNSNNNLEIYYETSAEHAKQTKADIRFWLPIIISNSISIAALIVAILAYIKK